MAPKSNGKQPTLETVQDKIPRRLRSIRPDIQREEVDDPSLYKERISIDPEKTVGRKNIRETDKEHIKALAESMNEEDQLQDCIGIYQPDGTVEIIAGRHRRLAMLVLNRERIKRGWKPKKLNVQVYKHGLTLDRIFTIEVAENLHKEMTTTEEAESIITLVQMYKEDLDREATLTQVASAIGRSPDKVRRAIRFANLNYEVVKMVRRSILTFEEGLELARIEGKKAQLKAAIHVLNYNIRRDNLRNYVDNVVLGDRLQDPLFTRQIVKELKDSESKVSLRNRFGQIAVSYAEYFRSIIYLNNHLPKRQRLYTRGVIDLAGEFVLSALKFLEISKESDPVLYRDISRYIKEHFGTPPFWKKKNRNSTKKK